MKRSINIVLTILSVAACLLSCQKVRDYDYSRWYADPEGSNVGRPLNVMSFNWRTESSNDPGETSWASRRPAVAAMLKDKSPVLMGCQECQPNQRNQILADDPRYLTIGGDLGYPNDETECDVIFYMRDSVEVLSHGTFFLTATPDIYSRLNQSIHYRVCTWGRMKMKSDGKEFYHFNTHIDYLTDAQQPEMDALLLKIKEINADHLPMFLTADWNTGEESEIFKDIKSYGFKSARLEAVIGDSYRTFNGFGSGPQTLDHCWFMGFSGVSRFTTVRDKYVGITYISDHYPINIILKF
ncbi:MAG: hypothetical protein J6X25_05090 [Bacteroidales bacterium]|nr:hypothetical protein [Bacteroidales bacterium]